MKCPFCSIIDNKVLDSRLSKENAAIRRRRECLNCNGRFTTYEQIEEIPLMIIKKDKRRETFQREKMRLGLQKACEKRSISIDTIEELIDDIERDLREKEGKEISSCIIGEKIMARLHTLDHVAYVRFASVYREFKDVNDFISELKSFPNANNQ
jgi:transcriptional repressor NrdR